MDEKFTSVSVPLSQEEYIALARAANKRNQKHKDQARFILRQALGLKNDDNSSEAHPLKAEQVTIYKNSAISEGSRPRQKSLRYGISLNLPIP